MKNVREPEVPRQTQLKLAASVLGMATAMFMLLRFAEQYFLAARFGPSQTLDAYFVAQVLILFASQCAVAITSTGVPIITSRRVMPGNEAVAPADFTIALCILSIGVGLGIVLICAAPWMVRIFGPGLDSQSSSLARLLFRCSVPAALLSVVAAGLRAHWHAQQKLVWPGILQLLMPLVSTCLAVLVALHLLGIEWVPLGAGAGALEFALALTKPFLRHSQAQGPRWSFPIARQFFVALLPVCLAMMLIPGMIAIGRVLASHLDAGNVSALSVAASLISIPGQIAATSIGIAILPRASSLFSNNDRTAAAALIERALRVTLFTATPFAALFWLYPDRIVRLLFHSASFDAHAVALTANALRGFSCGIPALAAMQVLVFALFASSAWRRVAGVTVFSFLLDVVLSRWFGHSVLGLAAAFSVTCYVSTAVLMLLLRQLVTGLSPAHLLLSFGKAAAAAAVPFGAVYLAWHHRESQTILQVSLCCAGYIGFGALFCGEEVRELIGLFQRRKPAVCNVQERTSLVAGAP